MSKCVATQLGARAALHWRSTVFDRIVMLALDESKWLAVAMVTGLVAAVVATRGRRSPRVQLVRAANVFYGCMIGVMGSGHLLGVTLKIAQDTVQRTPLLLVPLGVALAVPAWWLVIHAVSLETEDARWRRRAAALHVWLGGCLLAFGLHNWPLAATAGLNLAYLFHARRVAGWAIVSAMVAVNALLFVGALVFFASGQSFEQFGD